MGLIVRDILKIGENNLIKAGCADGKLDGELLFCHMRNIDRSHLFMEWSKMLEDELCDLYFKLLEERASGVPLQYITGHQEFMGFDFKVDESVLIPRQDTESLVETALNIIADNPKKIKKVLDLCTGSGAVAVSLSKLAAGIEVTASDISKAAIGVAKENVAANSVKVKVVEGDLFAPFRGKFGKTKFDMIVSNPPYIRSDIIPTLQREVKEHEPIMALDGGDDGLDFYRTILEEAPFYMKKKGILLLEIGHDQGQDIQRIAAQFAEYDETQIIKDIPGNDRVAVISLR